MSFFRVLLILTILMNVFFNDVSFAKMYKWTDENGVTHFSDTPPPEEEQTLETYETSTAPPDETQPEPGADTAQDEPAEESAEPEEIINLTAADIMGKWKHLGTSTQLNSKKISKPYKPQTWEFKNDGTVVYTIGDKTNRFPYKIEGKEIVTTPFPNNNKSFVVEKISGDRMIWKDPGWNSYIHIERVY